MGIAHYIKDLPVYEISTIAEGPPQNAVPFSGHPRQHPMEKHKFILINDPLGENPLVIEFNIDDILYVEDLHTVITEQGESLHLVKIWMRKGSWGVIFEPFEVGSPVSLGAKSREIRETYPDKQKNP